MPSLRLMDSLIQLKIEKQTLELRRDPLGYLINVFDGQGHTIITLSPAQAADLRDGLAYMLGE